MFSASFRFYGPLNDFLPVARRHATLVCDIASTASVKDLVEALGVPHTEIDYLVVNGRFVDFTYIVRDADRVAAYPSFCSLGVSAERLGPPPQAVPRFVADVHLGRLAGYLRLAGFDVAYRNDYSDPEIVALSADEDRVALTRDVGVLKHKAVARGYFVRATQPSRQLVEVVRRFDMVAHARPFSRCVRCNLALVAVGKGEIEHVLEPRTREHYQEFSRCPECGGVYWRGSHYERMRAFLDVAFAAAGRRPL